MWEVVWPALSARCLYGQASREALRKTPQTTHKQHTKPHGTAQNHANGPLAARCVASHVVAMTHPTTPIYLLASASPRRRMLLEAVGFSLQIQSTDVDETPLAGELPADMVMRLAKMKAAAAIPPAYPCIVIAADTTVALDEQSLGKPENDTNGYTMLRSLSGRTHDVFTGFCVRLLRNADDLTAEAIAKNPAFFHTETVCTRVGFRDLSDAEIHAYLRLGEHTDKAGGYGIQSGGGALVNQIIGSYPNVVGLPVDEVVKAIRHVETYLTHPETLSEISS